MSGAGQRFAVQHRTEYRYGRSMSDGYTVAHLLPRATPWQVVESTVLELDPVADEQAEHIDAFGNRVMRIGIHRPHDHLVVTARSVVRVDVPAPLAVGSQPTWEQVAAAVRDARDDLACEVGPFAARTPSTPALPEVVELCAGVMVPGRPIGEVVQALSTRIFSDFAFDAEFSDVSTPLADVLRARRGVCQDFAHLMLACLRAHGLAARYVSGYIETEPPPGQPKLAGSDASHAWCGVWAPGIGWFDVDPTNDQMPPRRHVTCAWGRDYTDVAPVRGVVIGPAAAQSLSVGVDVTALP
jgi:transglutaminase-like putative cysteine protease